MDSMFIRSHREHGFSRDGLRFYSHGLQYAYEFVVAVILRHRHVFVAGEVGLRYLFAFRILLASSPKTFLAFWRFFNTYRDGQDSIQGLESERKGTIWYSSSVAGFVMVVGKSGVSFCLKGHIVRITLSCLGKDVKGCVFGASGAVGALIW